MRVEMTVNGSEIVGEVEPRTLLVHFLRDIAGLTGTHVGCETSYCGSCTVLLDGVAVKSCTVLAVQARTSRVETIEGRGSRDRLDPIQEAFRQHHALQCGFCTPGMVMAVAALLADHPDPAADEIRHGLEGTLCRCTGYENIVAAVEHAAVALRGATPPAPPREA